MKIRVARLHGNAIIPTRKLEGDAGMDFYSLENYIVKPRNFLIAKTGIKVDIPEGFVGLIRPKSKNNHLIGGGVVDHGYKGEILFKIVNYFDHDLVIRYGDALGQMLIIPNVSPEPYEEDFEIKTARGSTGGIVTQLIQTEVVGEVESIEEVIYPKLFGKTWD